MIGTIMILVNATGLSTSDSPFFMILVAIVFWMVSYVIADINVLIFRRRLPKAPRTFKVPLGPVIPAIAIVGNLFMIWNIDGDPAARNLIFTIDGISVCRIKYLCRIVVQNQAKTAIVQTDTGS